MRLSNILKSESKLMVFKCYSLAHFNFCSTVWHFCCMSEIRKTKASGTLIVYCPQCQFVLLRTTRLVRFILFEEIKCLSRRMIQVYDSYKVNIFKSILLKKKLLILNLKIY